MSGLTHEAENGAAPDDLGVLTAYREPALFGAPGFGSPGFDEALDDDGGLRGGWRELWPALGGLGLDDLHARRAEADRLLEGDGVTYDLGVSPDRGGRRQWSLDPVPVPLLADEWAHLEAGVAQRALLLDALAADLYGPRTVLARGLVPPEVVYGHRGFVRQATGIRLPTARQLFLYSADLVRDGAGSWHVQADRTQAPSGAGYALENRVVTSKLLPGAYRAAQVRRLAPFFDTLRRSLGAVAPADGEAPRVVLLSPGPRSETSFEQGFLAARLGYPLAVGEDLTVRDGRVWLRSLGRLEPVDVVLRRVDAWWSDPLELRPDSQLGVPGLLEAARAGTVSVVNGLGSGVLENPGLLPCLPELSRALLGEALLLPSAPTYWCGDPTQLSYVLAHLDELVLKPISRSADARSVFGSTLSSAARDELSRRIKANPHLWVGQERLVLSSTPTLAAHRVEPRRMVLRTFAVADGESYHVMPGGLARVAPAIDSLRITNRDGAETKDVWVLAGAPLEPREVWLSEGPGAAAVEPVSAMSPRAAEDLFWLGRYAERAEDAIRLLRVVHLRADDFVRAPGGLPPHGVRSMEVLLQALTAVTTTYPGFIGPGAAGLLLAPQQELLGLVADGMRPGTVAHAVRRMLDAALSVRDQLSPDTWLVFGSLDRNLLELAASSDPEAAARTMLDRALEALLAFSGIASENMVRDAGWRFMDAGRRLERVLQLASLLRATVTRSSTVDADSLVIESVLGAAESIITYRRRYRARAAVETVLALLVVDRDNPRSLGYQLDQLGTDLRALPDVDLPASQMLRLHAELDRRVRDVDVAELAKVDSTGWRPALDSFLVGVLDEAAHLASVLDAEHFSHLAPQRPLTWISGGLS